jgi:hypothetical protein
MEDETTKVEDEETSEQEEESSEQESEQEESEESSEEESQEDEEETPPIRKSAAYWREQREKLEAKKERANYFKTKQETEDYGDDTEEKSNLNSELEPIKEFIKAQSDEKEMSEVLTKYPDAKKHQAKIEKYAKVYENVPLEGIARMVLFDQVNRKTEADKKAKASRLGGHSKRPEEKKEKTAWDMTEEEFQKEMSKVRMQNNY